MSFDPRSEGALNDIAGLARYHRGQDLRAYARGIREAAAERAARLETAADAVDARRAKDSADEEAARVLDLELTEITGHDAWARERCGEELWAREENARRKRGEAPRESSAMIAVREERQLREEVAAVLAERGGPRRFAGLDSKREAMWREQEQVAALREVQRRRAARAEAAAAANPENNEPVEAALAAEGEKL